MIVVVEGPSAAGKTTWCRTHFPEWTVWEHTVLDSARAPDRKTDPMAAAEYWANFNRTRWRQALEIEAEYGIAVCDTDPFKLHYVWSLWRIGKGECLDWDYEAQLNREMFAAGEIGIADLVLVSLPDADTLRQRKGDDSTRRRGHFELHVQLTEPLRDWYGAISALDPSRVICSLPEGGLASDHLVQGVRQNRTGSELFDQVINGLPEHPGMPDRFSS